MNTHRFVEHRGEDEVELEQVVPERLAAFELAGDCVRATARRRGDPVHLVKAVTLNNLEFSQWGGIWHGRAVLDV